MPIHSPRIEVHNAGWFLRLFGVNYRAQFWYTELLESNRKWNVKSYLGGYCTATTIEELDEFVDDIHRLVARTRPIPIRGPRRVIDQLSDHPIKK